MGRPGNELGLVGRPGNEADTSGEGLGMRLTHTHKASPLPPVR